MADFTNRQLAEIITQTAEKINNSVLKERKIANELEETVSKLQNEKKYLQELERKIDNIKSTSIKPDLSELNSFYESRTEENIKRLNSRLKVPNLSLYVWLSSVAMLIISFLVFFFTYSKTSETRAETQKEYKEQLLKNNIILSKENAELLKDMDLFFKNNPKAKDKFVQWRHNQR
jgi:Na+-translocating ferredoxin:NAD+ oxidoreductase RnfG subunit